VSEPGSRVKVVDRAKAKVVIKVEEVLRIDPAPQVLPRTHRRQPRTEPHHLTQPQIRPLIQPPVMHPPAEDAVGSRAHPSPRLQKARMHSRKPHPKPPVSPHLPINRTIRSWSSAAVAVASLNRVTMKLDVSARWQAVVVDLAGPEVPAHLEASVDSAIPRVPRSACLPAWA
jgi:hypothetical protein